MSQNVSEPDGAKICRIYDPTGIHHEMGTLFKAAKMNDLILKHPMDVVRYSKPVRVVDDIHFLTVEEQVKFLKAAERSHNY